jgi:hypothetical protein
MSESVSVGLWVSIVPCFLSLIAVSIVEPESESHGRHFAWLLGAGALHNLRRSLSLSDLRG